MEIKEISLSNIMVSEFNTRKDLAAGTDDAGLDDLANSIKQRGLIQPITVRARDNGQFEVVAGQRRFLACKQLGLPSITARVTSLDDAESTVVSLIENVHRAEMHPIDKARAYKQIYDRCGTHAEVAKQANVSPSTVSKYIRLLDLAPVIQDDLVTSDGPVGVGALSMLARLFAADDQEEARRLIDGFRYDIQIDLLRESEGDLDRLAELREKELSGSFQVVMCREGLCFEMSNELKAEVHSRISMGG